MYVILLIDENKILFYLVIFHNDEESGFWVSFPDLPECLTEGEDMDKAYEMAVDALGLTITSRKKKVKRYRNLHYQIM